MSPLEKRALGALISWPLQVGPVPEQHWCRDDPYAMGAIGTPIGLPKNIKRNVDSHFRKHVDIHIPFHAVQGTLRAVYDATERYKHPDVTVEDFGKGDFEECMEFMQRKYAWMVPLCQPLPLHEVKINPDSSIGYVLKQFAKQNNLPWKHKEDVYKDCPDLVRWYIQYAHIFKILPLWDTAGKSEILKEKKADNGVVRTFTYTDPFFTLAYAHMISGVKELFLWLSSDFKRFPARWGVSFVQGGFHTMMKELIDLITVKGDAKLWDASVTSVLHEAIFRFMAFLLNYKLGTPEWEKLRWFMDQCHISFVRMPDGVILVLFYKKSGDPWTTGGNCIAHMFILYAHLIWGCKEAGRDPLRASNQTRWNIFADDHLNGYPVWFEKWLTFEIRSKFYKRAGVTIHPAPEDHVQRGPVGTSFLGATVNLVDGRFVPEYSFLRLLAILACNEYGEEELEEVLCSIRCLVSTNSKAFEYYKWYVSTYHPNLISMLHEPIDYFSGAEVGGINKEEIPYFNPET